ncbi:MAG: spermidine/putrescine ABC transporter substrate-binding protein [Novosphingobium sp.]
MTSRLDMTRRTALGGLALAGLGAPLLSACLGEGQELSLAIWRDYLGETTLNDFYRATGIKVTPTIIADNEDLHARLTAGSHGFDLVVPSSQWVERMVREKLLAPINPSRLPNLANLEAPFANLPYDPGNAHSVPYTWLALGIGYRKSKVPRPPAGWKELLSAPERFGRVALPADPAVLFRLAAKALGHSANLFDPARLKQAEALLAAALPRTARLHSDGGQDLLLRGEADLAVLWNGDLAQVALEDPDIAFAVPQEGALLSCDCLCIPAGAKRPRNAHLLIDFLLDASTAAAIAGHIWFPTPNEAARQLLPPDYRGNPVLYPPKAKGVSEFIGDNPGLDTQFAAAMKRLQVPQ